MCGLVSTSFFFVAMAVADGIAAQSIFYAGEFDLLNSIHRKIQDDPEGNLRYDWVFEDKITAQKIIRAKSGRPLNFCTLWVQQLTPSVWVFAILSVSSSFIRPWKFFTWKKKKPAGSPAAASDADWSPRTEGKDVDESVDSVLRRELQKAREDIYTDTYRPVLGSLGVPRPIRTVVPDLDFLFIFIF